MKLTEDEYKILISLVSYGGVNMKRFYRDHDKFDAQYKKIKEFVVAMSKNIDKEAK